MVFKESRKREAMCLISVIMPTYNSAQTIRQSLDSIKKQTIDQSQIEVLVIDGNSTDNTREIAVEYGALVIDNPMRMPEYAKSIGIQIAKGRYGVFLDSDEILAKEDSFEKRIRLLNSMDGLQNVVPCGMLSLPEAPGAVRYANFVGDPFSNFVYYHYNGSYRMKGMKKLYRYEDAESGTVYHFDKEDVLPLFDAGSHMFDLEYARYLYNKNEDKDNFTSSLFDQIAESSGMTGQIDEDCIYHIPQMNGKTYRRKLIWRIKNNLFSKSAVGFATRRGKNKKLKMRQYLFVPYCVLILPILIDAIRMVIINRDLYFLNHVLYGWYVLVNVVYYYMLKLFGINAKEVSYGK